MIKILKLIIKIKALRIRAGLIIGKIKALVNFAWKNLRMMKMYGFI